MLNEDYKKTAIKELERSNKSYTIIYGNAIKSMERLLNSRQRAVNTILTIESYISGLANKPRDYEIKIGEFKVRYTKFNNRIEEIKKLDEKQKHYECGMGAGALVGVGGSAFVPTAAMAIAMTFGTASTGTAISALSGVAATNAALAWLGGGALVAGGAGMLGGQALLTLAGPVGWAIGGASIVGSALLKSSANRDIARKAEGSTRAIIKETKRIEKIDVTVSSWNKETIKLSNELTKKITGFRRKKDYALFTEEDKQELIIVMNMTEVLSKKLGDTVK